MSQTMHVNGSLILIQQQGDATAVHTFNDMFELTMQCCKNNAISDGDDEEHTARLCELRDAINDKILELWNKRHG